MFIFKLPNLKQKIKFSILLHIYILSFVFVIFHLKFFFYFYSNHFSLLSQFILIIIFFTIYCFFIDYFESPLTTCHATVAKESLDRCFTSGDGSRGSVLWSIGTFEYLIRIRSCGRTPVS